MCSSDLFLIRSAIEICESRNYSLRNTGSHFTRQKKIFRNGLFPKGMPSGNRLAVFCGRTELDIWQYTRAENIPVVPLYFAAPRPVVKRDGALIMRDDDRMPLLPGEVEETRMVRFRSLGCYPLSAAVESAAATLDEIIEEMIASRTSERSGRLIDSDEAASMEKKKREGYF